MVQLKVSNYAKSQWWGLKRVKFFSTILLNSSQRLMKRSFLEWRNHSRAGRLSYCNQRGPRNSEKTKRNGSWSGKNSSSLDGIRSRGSFLLTPFSFPLSLIPAPRKTNGQLRRPSLHLSRKGSAPALFPLFSKPLLIIFICNNFALSRSFNPFPYYHESHS